MVELQPDQRANMLDQLPEDDRLIVQRILDTNAIARRAPPCSILYTAPSRCCHVDACRNPAQCATLQRPAVHAEPSPPC
jgi:hypothetical protein